MADFLEAFADLESPGNLHPCLNCGRRFNSDTLERHAAICNNLKKRKPFDSSKQRLGGVVGSDKQLIKKSPDPVKPKKNNWKQKHEDFLNTIRSARGVTAAIKNGEPLPPPPPTTVNPDYVQCPHCSRRFNEHAAERHIQFCKEQKSRLGKSPSSAAKSRVAARTQYKPPPPSKRNPSSGVPSTKVRQQLPTKPTNGTTEYKSNRYEDHPLLSKNQAAKPQSANTPNRPGRLRNGGSAGTTKTTKNISGNVSKGQYSNRYKNNDNNYMEILDKDNNDVRLNAFTREVKHGRRASKPHNGSIDDLPSEVDKLNLFEKPHQNRRNITIRDPSPTLFDDYGQNIGNKPPQKHKSNPFPSRAQVHRPADRADTDGPKRLSKFCYECGTRYPVEHAKFCCECGTKRPYVE